MVDKQQVSEELRKIVERDGLLMPRAVVDAARSVSSPLHDWFEWDNDQAGDSWRMFQARQLIRSVQVEIEGRETNAYLNVRVEIKNEPVRGYMPAEKVFSDEELTQQVVNEALDELERWDDRYREYELLKGLVNKDKFPEVKSRVQSLAEESAA